MSVQNLPETPEAIHTQKCGLKVIFLARQMADVQREIQRANYVPTAEQKAKLDQLLVEYERASQEFSKAEAVHPYCVHPK